MKTKIAIILFPLFCLLFSFAVLITDPGFTYNLLDNPESVQPTQQLMDYFAGRAEMPQVFNTQEQSHLNDVRTDIYVAFALLIIVTLALLKLMKQNRPAIIKKGTILLGAISILAITIPFDKLFTMFHYVVFPQGNWMFAAKSTLISFYPNSFFAMFGLGIAIHAFITAAMLYYIEIVIRRG
jgi:uncharacterized membrane protein